jgi:hypothetical protein
LKFDKNNFKNTSNPYQKYFTSTFIVDQSKISHQVELTSLLDWKDHERRDARGEFE